MPVRMPNEPDDDLIGGLGEIIAAAEAMRIADEATRQALEKAVVDAGVAVSRTVNRSDPAAIVKAREAMAECRRLIDALKVEGERARAAVAEADRLSLRTADILARIRTIWEQIERGRRKPS